MFEKFGKKGVKGIAQFRKAMEAEHNANTAIAGAANLGKQWREAAGIETPADVTAYSASVFGQRWPKTKSGDHMSPISVRMNGEYFTEDADIAAVSVLCRAYNATAKDASRAAKAAGEAPKRKRQPTKAASEPAAKPANETPTSVAATATKKAVNITAIEQERATLAWFIKKITEVEREDNPLALLRAACNYKLQILDAKNPAPASEAEEAKPAPKRGRKSKAA